MRKYGIIWQDVMQDCFCLKKQRHVLKVLISIRRFQSIKKRHIMRENLLHMVRKRLKNWSKIRFPKNFRNSLKWFYRN